MHLGQMILQGIIREPIHQFIADVGQECLRILQVRALIDALNESEGTLREVTADRACLFNFLRYHCYNAGTQIWVARPSF